MAGLANGCWWPSADHGGMARVGLPRTAMHKIRVDALSLRGARDFTLATLRRWGAAERGPDVVIVVSELLTNAVRHALPRTGDAWPRRPIRLGLLQYGSWVLCAVSDPSRAVPVPQTPGSLAESGRGLHMICALSDQWGYTTPGSAGKIVWAMFYARPSAHA
jgi:Histidine kinase-like ATPase domain